MSDSHVIHDPSENTAEPDAPDIAELQRLLEEEKKKYLQLQNSAQRDSDLLAQVQKQNLQLLARQSDEKQVRVQLSAAVQNMRKENGALQIELTKYKSVAAELEQKLRIEMEAAEQSSIDWKKQHAKTQRKLEQEQQDARTVRLQRDDMANNLLALTEDKANLLAECHALQKHAEEAEQKHRRVQSRALVAANAPSSADSKARAREKKQNEQVSKMAEKVFALVAQIQQMEDQEREYREEISRLKENLISVQNKNAAMDERHVQSNRLIERTQNANRTLQDKFLKQSQTLNQVKQDMNMLEKELVKVNRSLRQKNYSTQTSDYKSRRPRSTACS
jgi:hypothetical protein